MSDFLGEGLGEVKPNPIFHMKLLIKVSDEGGLKSEKKNFRRSMYVDVSHIYMHILMLFCNAFHLNFENLPRTRENVFVRFW